MASLLVRYQGPMGTDINTSVRHGILSDEPQRGARAADRDADQGLLDGARDSDELHRQLDQPRGRARPGDHRVVGGGRAGGARARAASSAKRIKELYGVVPGTLDFSAEQSYLQPPDDQIDIVHVIKGVIEAETGAIEHYNPGHRVDCEGKDPVTQDMVTAILARRGRAPAAVRGLPARVPAAKVWPRTRGGPSAASRRTSRRGWWRSP